MSPAPSGSPQVRHLRTRSLAAAGCYALAAAGPARLLYVLLAPPQPGVPFRDGLLRFLALSSLGSSIGALLLTTSALAVGFALLSVWQLLCGRRPGPAPGALRIGGLMLTLVSVPTAMLSAVLGGLGLYLSGRQDADQATAAFQPTVAMPKEPPELVPSGWSDTVVVQPKPLLTPMLSLFLRLVATLTIAAGLVVAVFFWLQNDRAALLLPLLVLVPVLVFHRNNTGLLLGLAALSVVLGFSSCAANFRWGGG